VTLRHREVGKPLATFRALAVAAYSMTASTSYASLLARFESRISVCSLLVLEGVADGIAVVGGVFGAAPHDDIVPLIGDCCDLDSCDRHTSESKWSMRHRDQCAVVHGYPGAPGSHVTCQRQNLSSLTTGSTIPNVGESPGSSVNPTFPAGSPYALPLISIR